MEKYVPDTRLAEAERERDAQRAAGKLLGRELQAAGARDTDLLKERALADELAEMLWVADRRLSGEWAMYPKQEQVRAALDRHRQRREPMPA